MSNVDYLFTSESEEDWDDWDAKFEVLRFQEIEGLVQLKHLISQKDQDEIMSCINKEGWLNEENGINQAMRFGKLPVFALRIADAVPLDVLPENIRYRQPLFNQMAINFYAPGEGLKSHVDLLKFEDGVVIVSFLSTLVMNFTKDEDIVKVLLEPGDALVLSGVARYDWKHGFDSVRQEDFEDRVIVREKRLSITLRRLVPQ
eukprot:TRINITY_DN1144_c0_g1_i1.p2 TRINITY_DN1144_c0_g1~~TRINITY_DN1144_c0_g1_i1.p2  ORF type:complete len:202 (-),score=25.71 TRINITY_DN1144_c0_g1_i1:221-826(-)